VAYLTVSLYRLAFARAKSFQKDRTRSGLWGGIYGNDPPDPARKMKYFIDPQQRRYKPATSPAKGGLLGLERQFKVHGLALMDAPFTGQWAARNRGWNRSKTDSFRGSRPGPMACLLRSGSATPRLQARCPDGSWFPAVSLATPICQRTDERHRAGLLRQKFTTFSGSCSPMAVKNGIVTYAAPSAAKKENPTATRRTAGQEPLQP
jgi:hypothetical protein